MRPMIIEFNYLISVMGFTCSFLLIKKGHIYKDASRFMFFLSVAALLGGFVHHIEQNSAAVSEFIAQVNKHMPSFIDPISLDGIQTRLWFLTIEAIGFAEFYFMYLFIDPILPNRLSFIKTYLFCALIIFCIVAFITPTYSFVVMFHVFSHLIMICFSLYLIFYRKFYMAGLLILLLIYNLSIGVMQQLMANNVISSGPLHYNDWYHIGTVIFILMLYYLFTKGKLIEKLNAFKII